MSNISDFDARVVKLEGRRLTTSHRLVRGLQSNVTIDRTPVGHCGDNGALASERHLMPFAKTHVTPAEAASNLIADVAATVDNPVVISIYGHGNAGNIACGGGQCPDVSQTVAWWTSSFWEPAFAPLKEMLNRRHRDGPRTQLFVWLWGCWVGAEQDGVSTLDEIMRATAAAVVTAPTGVTWCDGTQVGITPPTAEWQTVRAEQPLPAPLPKQGMATVLDIVNDTLVDRGHVLLKTTTGGMELPLDELISMSSEPNCDGCHGERKGVVTLDKHALRALVAASGLSRPVEFPGRIMALKTGRLRIRYASGGQEQETVLNILGDSVLQDEVYPEVSYWTRADFGGIISKIRTM